MADTNQTQFDQSVVAIMHGIKMQEGGGKINYNNPTGKNGERGAFQWTPDTWKSVAEKYLGDPNAPITPDNENKAAYLRIKEAKDAGKSPADIAAMWNTGGDVATANKVGAGVNSAGASYNAPKYVDSVINYAKSYAQKNKATTTTTKTQPQNLQQTQSFTGAMAKKGFDTGTSGTTAQSVSSDTTDTVDIIKAIPGAVVGSEIGLGNDIAAAIGGNAYTKQFSALPEADQQYLTTIIQLRNKFKNEGKDFTHYQKLIENYKASNGENIIDVFPALKKSNEQVIGDIAGTALDIVGAGELSAGAKETQLGFGATEELAKETAQKGASFTQRAISGAKKGVTLGAGFGLAGGMQQNENLPDLAKSTVYGAVGGAVVGAGVEGAFGKRLQKTDDQKLIDIISPKPTPTQAKLAQVQGRFVEGREPTLFRSGTADQILPSDKINSAVDTIKRRIPNYENMSETQLYNAADAWGGNIAKNLEVPMKNTPINKDVTGRAFEEWTALKKAQSETADFVDNKTGNKMLQNQFETILKKLQWDIVDETTGKFKKPTPKTLDDVWKAAIEYDQSIPTATKKANEMSDAKLQFRKEMWLQNRAILRNILKDAKVGLGKQAQQAFEDMSNLFEVKQNILSKTKVETKIKPSKIKQFFDTTTGKVVAGAAGATVLGATGLPKKAIDIVSGGAL